MKFSRFNVIETGWSYTKLLKILKEIDKEMRAYAT